MLFLEIAMGVIVVLLFLLWLRDAKKFSGWMEDRSSGKMTTKELAGQLKAYIVLGIIFCVLMIALLFVTFR